MDIKVRFESEGESIQIGKDSDIKLLSIEGIGDINTALSSRDNVAGDGSVLEQKKIAARNIAIEGEFVGRHKRDDRKKIITFFNAHRKSRLFLTMEGVTRVIEYTVENLVAPLTNVNKPLKFLLQLYCPDPYWQSVEPFKEDMAIFVGMFEFPLDIPADEGVLFGEQGEEIVITNDSDAETPLRIEFNGPAENPKVTNLTTGEYLLVDRTIAAEERLVIDTDIENTLVEIHDENGFVENAFHWIDLGSSFWQLKTGDNKIKYEADIGMDTALVKIEYKKRYLGV